MPEPIDDDPRALLAQVRLLHRTATGSRCLGCGDPWPCPDAALADRFEALAEALQSASLHVDQAIRQGNKLADDLGLYDRITTTQAAWFGVLRGELADARDALGAWVPTRAGEG